MTASELSALMIGADRVDTGTISQFSTDDHTVVAMIDDGIVAALFMDGRPIDPTPASLRSL
jgi:hypothetical protein